MPEPLIVDLAWLAIGTKASYSQLLVFTKYNALPDMGGPQPGASLAEQLGRQDTSSWAIDPLTHEPGNSYVFVWETNDCLSINACTVN